MVKHLPDASPANPAHPQPKTPVPFITPAAAAADGPVPIPRAPAATAVEAAIITPPPFKPK